MKIALQYVSDSAGKTKPVQVAHCRLGEANDQAQET